jgi:hypothetical protein
LSWGEKKSRRNTEIVRVMGLALSRNKLLSGSLFLGKGAKSVESESDIPKNLFPREDCNRSRGFLPNMFGSWHTSPSESHSDVSGAGARAGKFKTPGHPSHAPAGRARPAGSPLGRRGGPGRIAELDSPACPTHPGPSNLPARRGLRDSDDAIARAWTVTRQPAELELES